MPLPLSIVFARRAWLPVVLVCGITAAGEPGTAGNDYLGKSVDGISAGLRPATLETTMSPSGNNAEPIVCRFVVKNVSDKPLKLNLYDWQEEHLVLDVRGPDGQSVRIAPLPGKAKIRDHLAGDYPTLAPGGATGIPLGFPGKIGWKMVSILKPGVYTVTATYKNTAEQKHKLAAGCWVGEATSAPLTIAVGKAE